MVKNIKQLLILAGVYCIIFMAFYYLLPAQNDIDDSLVVNVSNTEVNMEDYVVRVVAGEMPASFEMEALKAQCVAVRSYAIAHKLNVDTTTNTQVFKSEEELRASWGNDYDYYLHRITEATEATRGEVMYYDDTVISAYYFAASNGKTSLSGEYFNIDLPYIKSVSSDLDLEDYGSAIVTTSFSLANLRNLLNTTGNVAITILSRYDTHRVKEVQVNDTIYTGKQFRELLGLRSSDFSVKKTANGYDITTIGYGHGVGMSQYGANGLAKKGYTYKEILAYYYNDIEVKKYQN